MKQNTSPNIITGWISNGNWSQIDAFDENDVSIHPMLKVMQISLKD